MKNLLILSALTLSLFGHSEEDTGRCNFDTTYIAKELGANGFPLQIRDSRKMEVPKDFSAYFRFEDTGKITGISREDYTQALQSNDPLTQNRHFHIQKNSYLSHGKHLDLSVLFANGVHVKATSSNHYESPYAELTAHLKEAPQHTKALGYTLYFNCLEY